MTDKPDTSAEAVERLARLYDDAGLCRATSQHPSHAHTAFTLRALVAERDAARAEVARMTQRPEPPPEPNPQWMQRVKGLAHIPVPPDWSAMGGAKPTVTLEQRVEALEHRMRNR